MTLHADAHSVLTAWAAPDEQQETLRLRYLAHLDDRPDAMWRECHPDHLTASVLIFSSDHRLVLLTLHRVVRRWLQTGGHCEPGDVALAEAALREGREESGIDILSIDPTPVWLSHHAVPHCGPIRPSHHFDVQYVAVAPPDAVEVISEESDDLRWWDVSDLPPGTDDSVRALTRAGVRRLRGTP